MDIDDNISEPVIRVNFTINLSPRLASHALNVNSKILSWWRGDWVLENTIGINNTMHNIIASKHKRDIRRYE